MAAVRYIAIILVIAALTWLVMDQLLSSPGGKPSSVEITLAGETFTLEVAADDAAIERGLMGRESIDPKGGMLFVFKAPRIPSFWMKNCLVDIDVIFVDEVGVIVGLHEMKAEPPRGPNETEMAYENRLVRYPAQRRALFAIELQAGSIRRLGLKMNDRLSMDIPRLKRLAH